MKTLYAVNFAGFVNLQDEPKYEGKNMLDATDNPNYLKDAEEICKRVNAYPSLIQTLKDLKEVLRKKGLNLHADGIEKQLKELEII